MSVLLHAREPVGCTVAGLGVLGFGASGGLLGDGVLGGCGVAGAELAVLVDVLSCQAVSWFIHRRRGAVGAILQQRTPVLHGTMCMKLRAH